VSTRVPSRSKITPSYFNALTSSLSPAATRPCACEADREQPGVRTAA
jgi:hypothetical protein